MWTGHNTRPEQELSQDDQQQLTSENVLELTHGCLVVSSAGRQLHDYKNVPELLRVIRDAIKTHQSLYEEAKILCRDISLNSIMFTKPEEADNSTSMLVGMITVARIDEEGNHERTEASDMTGTPMFMAIELLQNVAQNIKHTYRHDLESFFYVFLSGCLSNGWKNDPQPPNPLLRWCDLSHENVAQAKQSDMDRRFFLNDILPQFSPAFIPLKGLARCLRDILFSREALYIGTPKDHSRIYSEMIDAFDTAIQSMESTTLSQEDSHHRSMYLLRGGSRA